VVVLAATDPANPFGTMLKWPAQGAEGAGRGATRTVGAQVILVNGYLAAYISRGGRQILAWLPEDEPQQSTIGRPLARQLATMARLGGLIIAEVAGVPAGEHPLAPFLVEAGFHPSAMGFMMRRAAAASESATQKVKAEVDA
jgi:ATP-dependent Lhr-like helicase